MQKQSTNTQSIVRNTCPNMWLLKAESVVYFDFTLLIFFIIEIVTMNNINHFIEKKYSHI